MSSGSWRRLAAPDDSRRPLPLWILLAEGRSVEATTDRVCNAYSCIFMPSYMFSHAPAYSFHFPGYSRILFHIPASSCIFLHILAFLYIPTYSNNSCISYIFLYIPASGGFWRPLPVLGGPCPFGCSWRRGGLLKQLLIRFVMQIPA